MENSLFHGVATAIVTPFKNGRVDFESFEKLIERQIAGKIAALVFLGTTGEPCALSCYEYEKILRFAVETVNKRVPVIAGAGSNSTATAVKKAVVSEKSGADGLLVVTPYYNKCSDSGLTAHYEAVKKAANLPVIAYNVPSRTGYNLTPALALKLYKSGFIAGIKEASGDKKQIRETIETFKNRIPVYSGNDDKNLFFYERGASGAISVTSNVFPEAAVNVYNEVSAGNSKKAKAVQSKLKRINSALFSSVNPIPVKYALSTLSLCENELRLPLTPLSEDKRGEVFAAINELKEIFL